MKQLETIFAELGITQYLDVFVDQGFDTWETILDITESDLDALGVKLGHRRKLQRRIANFRGLAPEACLATLTPQSSVDEQKPEPQLTTSIKPESHETTTTVVAKRKYRRHPKPDENAPERPPSAYVLFSNKMRDDLQGRNLSFTEIAKLVGEHWQNLSVAEKEPFESQAQAAKDRYNSEWADYKKTANYRRYQEYLEEFKAKYAHQNKDKDATKRVKLSSQGGLEHHGKAAAQNRTSRSGSGSPDADGRITERASRRHSRLGSVLSTTDHVSATPASQHASIDEAVFSPVSHTLDRRSSELSPIITASPRETVLTHHRRPVWHDEQYTEQNGAPRLLPSLSDVFDPRAAPSSGQASVGDAGGFPFPRSYNPDSTGPPPGLIGGETKPPTLKKEQSSATSTSSGSSYSYPRTPIEGTLPIHALLSEKPLLPVESIAQFHGAAMLSDNKPSFLQRQLPNAVYANGFASSSLHVTQQSTPLPTPQQQPYPAKYAAHHLDIKPEPNLDGMSALLRAGEIVDRESR